MARIEHGHEHHRHREVVLGDAAEAPVAAGCGMPQRRPHQPHGPGQLVGADVEVGAVLARERRCRGVLGGGGGAHGEGGTTADRRAVLDHRLDDRRGELDRQEGVVDPLLLALVVLGVGQLAGAELVQEGGDGRVGREEPVGGGGDDAGLGDLRPQRDEDVQRRALPAGGFVREAGSVDPRDERFPLSHRGSCAIRPDSC